MAGSFTVPSVSVRTARTGASVKANEFGMLAMQERAYEKRGEQYLLILYMIKPMRGGRRCSEC